MTTATTTMTSGGDGGGRGPELALNSRRSMSMRRPANMDPQQPYLVLPNAVVDWLWMSTPLCYIVRDRPLRREWYTMVTVGIHGGRQCCWWVDGNNNRYFVRTDIDILDGVPVLEGSTDGQNWHPLTFSMRLRRWLMSVVHHPMTPVPPRAVHWLNQQQLRLRE